MKCGGRKNMDKVKKAFLVAFIIAFLGVSGIAFAGTETCEKKVIMFLMDNISFQDIENHGGENMHFLLNKGALALVNTNSGAGYTDSNAYATIGAGSYATSSAFGNKFGGYDDFIGREPVPILYQRNTGFEMQKPNIANIDITNLKRNNDNLNRPVKVGYLGTILRQHGLKTALIGNENLEIDEIRTNAGLIVMDEKGIIDYGKVNESVLSQDPLSPYGIKTDYDALYDYYLDLRDKANLIVIQSGDSFRLNKYMKNLSDDMYLAAKDRLFGEADKFIGNVLEDIDENTLFVLVVPFPSHPNSSEGKKLTPIIAHSKSISRGIITSGTTKRDGIITNTDIAPEILNFLGVSPQSPMTGHHFQYKSHQNPLEFLYELEEMTVYNYKARPSIIKIFIVLILLVLITSLGLMIYGKKSLPLFKPFITAIMLVPMMFLLIPLLKPWNHIRFAFFAILGIILASVILHYFIRDDLCIMALVFLMSTGLIIIDTFLKNPLMKISILGYDPISGARFYGIGNEYMGFLLGSTITGTCALIDRFKEKSKLIKSLSLVLYLLVLFTLAMPNLGTNVGGTIAAFIAFSVAALLLLRGDIYIKDFAIIGILLVLALGGLFLYDSFRPSSQQSHIGQTGVLVKQNTITALFQIFGRKLSMNYKLIRKSNWTLVLFAIIAVLIILFRWPMGILKNIFKKYHHLYFGFIAGIIGALAAFAVNDSGVVAAATFMIPIGMPLILLCVDELYEQQKTS